MVFSSGREGINLYIWLISPLLLGKRQRATLASFGMSFQIGTNVWKGSAVSFSMEQKRNNTFLCIAGEYLPNHTVLHSREAYTVRISNFTWNGNSKLGINMSTK
jgi:hypothetical protein